jgi:hypothetical protein
VGRGRERADGVAGGVEREPVGARLGGDGLASVQRDGAGHLEDAGLTDVDVAAIERGIEEDDVRRAGDGLESQDRAAVGVDVHGHARVARGELPAAPDAEVEPVRPRVSDREQAADADRVSGANDHARWRIGDVDVERLAARIVHRPASPAGHGHAGKHPALSGHLAGGVRSVAGRRSAAATHRPERRTAVHRRRTFAISCRRGRRREHSEPPRAAPDCPGACRFWWHGV